MSAARAARVSRACPVCRASRSVTLHVNAMLPLDGIDLSYDVRECLDCGAGFADGLASPAEYDRYYRECSKYDVVMDRAAIPAADLVRAATAVALGGEAPRGRPAAVLDIGCGVGTLLAAFSDAGASRLVGVDPGPDSPAAARRLHGLDDVAVGTWRDVLDREDLHGFDLFCMTGVLEHLPEVDAVLAGLRARMADSACVLLEVPAVECFLDGEFEPFGEFSLEHVNFFSEPGLRRLAARLGFRVLGARLERPGGGVTGSLFALLEPARSAPVRDVERCRGLREYVAASAAALEHVVAGWVRQVGDAPVALYGAGSHSARLVATLQSRGLAGQVVRVVDGNPNLQGRRFGHWIVESPAVLGDDPSLAVVVSSFRSQAAIAKSLRARLRSPVHTLYDQVPLAPVGSR